LGLRLGSSRTEKLTKNSDPKGRWVQERIGGEAKVTRPYSMNHFVLGQHERGAAWGGNEFKTCAGGGDRKDYCPARKRGESRRSRSNADGGEIVEMQTRNIVGGISSSWKASGVAKYPRRCRLRLRAVTVRAVWHES